MNYLCALKKRLRDGLMIRKFKHLLKYDIHFKELLQGSILSFGVKVLGTVIAFMATIITTRYYGADALGVTSLVFVILNFANIIGKVGVETASLKFIAQYHSQNKPELVKEIYVKAFMVILSVSIPLGILLYFIAPILANNVFHKAYLEEFIRVQGFLVTPLALTYLNFECLRGLKKVGLFMFFNSVALYLFSALIMLGALVYFGGKFIPKIYCNSTTVMAQNVSVLLTFFLSMIVWLRTSKFFKVKVTHVIPYGELLSVSMPMLLASSIFFIQNWTATFILGIYGTDVDVGVFNTIQRISSISSIFLLAINSISAPKFSELFTKGDMHGFQRFVTKSTQMIFFSSLPVLIAFCLFPELVLRFFGKAFVIGSIPLIIMTVGQFLGIISGSVGYLLIMTGYQRIYQNIILFTSFMNIILCMLFIPTMGVLGAAIANSITVILWNFMAVISIKRKLNIISVYFPGISFLKRYYSNFAINS